MNHALIASEVLASLGGAGNILANGICMTRLRVIVDDAALVDTKRLSSTRGVLGIVRRGSKGIEVVFGPGIVEEVFEEFSLLTGMSGNARDLARLEKAPVSTIQVQISPSKRMSHDSQADALATIAGDEEDLAGLLEDDRDDERILRELLDEETMDSIDDGRRLLVINGPNLNLLGIREPEIYGHEDYATLLKTCNAAAHDAGFSGCTCVQSNHEGDLVDAIQNAYGTFDAIVINPAAYTHTSIALLDALKAVGIPAIEVHISDINDREEFRRISYVREACIGVVSGLGLNGYRKAIFDLAEHLGIKSS